ncbi:MAG TPA: diguanylate cyclase [Blastocatellia bacterium]|nr:diguanylate cyclase [Blastocatellia bacterium]
MAALQQTEQQRKVSLYQALILVTGAALWLGGLPKLLLLPRQTLIELSLLVLIVALASLRSFVIPAVNLRFITRQDSCITASDAIILLMIVAYGGAPAICAAGIDGYVGSRASIPATNPKRAIISLRSAATMSISIALASLVARYCLGEPPSFQAGNYSRPIAQVMVALVVGGAAHFLINSSIVASFVALRNRRSFFSEWTGNYLWMGASSFPAVLAAGIIYFGISRFGWSAWLVTLPIFLAGYLSIKLYYSKLEEKDALAREISAIHLRSIEALAKAVVARDQVAHDHIKRVQTLAMGLGRYCRLSENETAALRAGALLYDVGKLAVPDYILNKPGRLTPAEYERMKIHPLIGEEIVSTMEFPYPVAPLVRHHHERWDGRGYPDGLHGEQIPIGARILALVISYDVLTNDQPYQKRRSREEALEALEADSGQSFDPELVSLFITHLNEFEQEADRGMLAQVAELNSSQSLSVVTDPAKERRRSDATWVERINSAHRDFDTLYRMAQSFASSLDLDTTLGIINEQLRSLIFFDTCVIYLTLPEGGAAEARYADGPGSRAFANRKVAFGEGLTGWVLAHKEHFYNADPALDSDELNNRNEEGRSHRDFRNLYVFPLIKDEETLGAVALYSLSPDQYTPDHIRLIEMATPIASEAVNNALRYARREEETLTDDLTGLGNSRAIPVAGERELQRCQQNGMTMTVLMMDLDRFKQVNDTWGHRAGSRMLSELGPLIARTLRRSDFLARYGGDEFFALLPDTSYEDAQIVIRRIEEDVNDHQMEVAPGRSVSVGISIGAAELGRDGQSLEELIMKADQEMYAVKARHKGQPRTTSLPDDSSLALTMQSSV